MGHSTGVAGKLGSLNNGGQWLYRSSGWCVNIGSHLREESPSKSFKHSAMLTDSNIRGSFFCGKHKRELNIVKRNKKSLVNMMNPHGSRRGRNREEDQWLGFNH